MTTPDFTLIMAQYERILLELRAVNRKLDTLTDDVGNLKPRMSASERQLGEINARLDRVDLRLEHIERRLELVSP